MNSMKYPQEKLYKEIHKLMNPFQIDWSHRWFYPKYHCKQININATNKRPFRITHFLEIYKRSTCFHHCKVLKWTLESTHNHKPQPQTSFIVAPWIYKQPWYNFHISVTKSHTKHTSSKKFFEVISLPKHNHGLSLSSLEL